MTYQDAIQAYLENTSEKAARLGVARSTPYNWKKRPEMADIHRIREDLAEQLTAINARIAIMEWNTTAHGRIMDEKQSDD